MSTEPNSDEEPNAHALNTIIITYNCVPLGNKPSNPKHLKTNQSNPKKKWQPQKITSSQKQDKTAQNDENDIAKVCSCKNTSATPSTPSASIQQDYGFSSKPKPRGNLRESIRLKSGSEKEGPRGQLVGLRKNVKVVKNSGKKVTFKSKAIKKTPSEKRGRNNNSGKKVTFKSKAIKKTLSEKRGRNIANKIRDSNKTKNDDIEMCPFHGVPIPKKLNWF